MKNGVYGIREMAIADCAANGAYPKTFDYKFKAIVQGSLSFNDAAAGTTDVEIEDSDDPYVVLTSSAKTKGFTVQTYDMSAETYAALLNYTTSDVWNVEPPKEAKVFKAVQIVTEDLDDIPSKTFEWSKMQLTVTRSGSIGKTGLPNLNIEFRQVSVYDSNGNIVSGHRFRDTSSTPTN